MPADPLWVAGRYEVQQVLGRGGTAVAYRVHDHNTAKDVALKLLTVSAQETQRARAVELFEREFHTLVQLAHPRVVEAFDYGVDEGTPYYTMEILDGGDLRELGRLSYQEVCTLAYEVCSALSLLHSRRLVHRDLTPRNIRRTENGRAKLIDFGLLSTMGPTGLVAGTPPYVAPELLHTMTLDGRSDLFSLGATMYFALTGCAAFPARRFEQLRDVWRTSPPPPSKVVADIPKAMDELVLSLLRIDVGSRPKSAAEVMERLVPLLPRAPDPELMAARAHLSTPKLVGRVDVIARLRLQVVRTMRGRGRGVVISGPAGVGRSRMVDAFVLEAKLVGATTVRASADNAAAGPFGVAAAIAAQLHAASPSLSLVAARNSRSAYETLFAAQSERTTRPIASGGAETLIDITNPALDRASIQRALQAWVLELARAKPLAIAVDDAERMDEPSAAFLASLTWADGRNRLVYALSVASNTPPTAPQALEVLHEHAVETELHPLPESETTALLRSVFGDVPHLQALGRRVHALCSGLPRECMVLAQHLVDEGAISYSGGGWSLPAELPPEVLPASMEEALERRLHALSEPARRLCLLLALTVFDRLSRSELLLLEDVEASTLDQAIDELTISKLVAGSLAGYTLCHAGLQRMLVASASAPERLQAHADLAHIYTSIENQPMAAAFHLLRSGEEEAGLDHILMRGQDAASRTKLGTEGPDKIGADRAAETLRLALETAERLGRPTRDLQVLWVLLAGMSARGDDSRNFYRVQADWLAQLKRESGFDDWKDTDTDADAATRAVATVGAAMERYNQTPEAERALAPPDAIKQLVAYVAIAVAVAGRVMDHVLMASLPDLLKPFAPLNPIIQAMYDNVMSAKLAGAGKMEDARERAVRAYEQFSTMTGEDLSIVKPVVAAVGHMIAGLDCVLGVHSDWIKRLETDEHDRNQVVSSFYILQAVALHQGDWEGAERYRQHAERLALQTKSRSMFSTIQWNLGVHAMARDLTGLRQVRTAVHAMADKHPGWFQAKHIADAHYGVLCGDLAAALVSARTASQPIHGGYSPWNVRARVLEVEILVEMGEFELARSLGEPVLAECQERGVRFMARNMACALALAEAKAGDLDAASARLDAVIEEQLSLNISGLLLGKSYEARARVAIAANNAKVFDHFSTLAAQHYRVGENSVLGALYGRLMEHARRAGLRSSADVLVATRSDTTVTSFTGASTSLGGCDDRRKRAQHALGVLCDGNQAARGYLFLLTESGLTLAASNVPGALPTSLHTYAREYVQLEIADESCTITQDDVGTAVDTGTVSGVWKAPDGREFGALLLGADIDDEYHIAGVAMLTRDASQDAAAVARLASLLATTLINSGDCVAALAAA